MNDPAPGAPGAGEGPAAGGCRVWRFGAGAVRRIVAGRKRAAVVSVAANPGLVVGEVVSAAPDGADAAVPVRVTGMSEPVDQAGVDAAASTVGVALADVTVVRSWDTYFRNVTRNAARTAARIAARDGARNVAAGAGGDQVAAPGLVRVVSFVVAGEVSGTIPQRRYGTPKRKRKPAPPPPPKKPAPAPKKPKVKATPMTGPEQWLVVSMPPSGSPPVPSGSGSGVPPIRPGSRLHPGDVSTVTGRVEQVLDRLRPPTAMRQAVSRVVDALSEERVCGPAGLSAPARGRLRGDLGAATAWLERNKLLVAGLAWNPRLLVGVRVHRTAAGPVAARAARLRTLLGKFRASPALLQNWCQTGQLAGLEFRDDGAEGPTHAQVFVITAVATLPDDGGVVERAGRASSKKAAQRAAADTLVLALTD